MSTGDRLSGASLRVLCFMFLAGFLSTLSGCSALPRDVSTAPVVLGPPVAEFQISGRAMLRHEQRLDHFRFDWSHTDKHDELMLTSPLGQGLAQVLRTEDSTTLRWPDGRTQQFTDFPSLANQLLGQPIPLDELAQWLRGTYPQLNGHVDGWQVAVESTYRYAPAGTETPGHILPKSLSVRQHETLLRLIIDDREGAP